MCSTAFEEKKAGIMSVFYMASHEAIEDLTG
jgi:hypothetical protein